MLKKVRKTSEVCEDCGVKNYPIWFCSNVFWNSVMSDEKRGNEERGKLICIHCFTLRAEKKYKVIAWQLMPEFNWTKNV